MVLSRSVIGIWLVLGLFASVAHAGPAQPRRECYLFRMGTPGDEVEYCFQIRAANPKATDSCGDEDPSHSICLSYGRPGEPPDETSLTEHDLAQMLDGYTLSDFRSLHQGQRMSLPSPDGSDGKLVFLKRMNPPNPVLNSAPVPKKAAPARPAAPHQVPMVQIPSRRDWLRGLPEDLLPGVRDWLPHPIPPRVDGKGPPTNLDWVVGQAAACQGGDLNFVASTYAAMHVPSPKFAALALVAENCFRGKRSNKNAVGPCQFEKPAARRFGLNVDPPGPDERLKLQTCAPAAARYLLSNIAGLKSGSCSGSPILKAVMQYNGGEHWREPVFCRESDAEALIGAAEPETYARRILGMAYVLDAGLPQIQHAIIVANAPPPGSKKTTASRRKRTTMAILKDDASPAAGATQAD